MIVMPEAMELREQINFKSSRDNLHVVEKIVDEVCAQSQVSEDHYGNLLIALTEAVNNAIIHGNGNDPNKQITLEYATSAQEIEFRIKDEGTGFDFDNLPDPTDPANLEKPNGRGVFLMRNLADEVNFEDEGRLVELKFNIAN